MVTRYRQAAWLKQFIFCSCLVLVLISRVHATNGMRVIGVGPVQRSMGGASTALPLDSAVSLTNPAALIELDRRLDISATFFDPHVRYRAYSAGGMVTKNNTFINSDMSPCYIPAVGVTLPVNKAATFGLGTYGVCGMGVKYPSNLYNNVTYTKYHYMKLTPAMAYRLNEKSSVGAAFNLGYAMMEFNAGSPAEKPHNDGDALGLGFTIGTLYQFNDTIALGLAYESKQSFSDFEFSTSSGTDKLRLNQPQSLTVGLAVKPAKRLRMAFDVEWIDWPQTVGKNMPRYTKNSSGATPWNMNWDEQLIYKLGFEYDLNKSAKVRFGYNYARNPLDSSRAFENISFPAIAEHHITGGLAIQLNDKKILNIGAMYAPQVSLHTANANQFIDSAKTQMYQYSIDVGITCMF
jgi:long-chain fatty acid transport protein